MNTITITSKTDTEGAMLAAVTYTEAEVLDLIKKAEDLRDNYKRLDAAWKELRDLRYKVRDFFSEGEWSDGETTCNKGDVNLLLESIGANKLTSQYTGTFTITGSFTIEAEDEDAAESAFTDYVDISFNEGDYSMDNVEVQDIEEDN